MYNKTKIKSKAKQSNNALTTGSRNELIQIQSINGEQLIDAKELHQFLKIKTPFNHWIARRIDEYQFKLNQDFWSNLTKRAKGRPTTDYQLTLDMAKELAMIERNDKGRQIRQYFIACEKKMRQQLVALPSTNQNLKGIKPIKINGLKLFPYRQVITQLGYSTKGSISNRKNRYSQHFITFGGINYITEDYANHLAHQRAVTINRNVLKAQQGILPLNFGDTTNLLNAKIY